jgi:hypothetical protein
MFEKNAEEYADEKCGTIETEEKKFCRLDWQRGAEFGYNKANEWHYVKDELPDHNGQFYVALKGKTETFTLNYDYDEYDESKMVWLDDDDTNFDDEVYAWHEKLKAPKEIE